MSGPLTNPTTPTPPTPQDRLVPRETFLPFSTPDIGEAEINEVIDTLRSGWISTGPKTRRFEELFAEATGASHAIAVSSCTDALLLALQALGIGAGKSDEAPDEVLLSTMTFCSAANVVMHRGAVPVPVDVDDELNIDPARIEAAITERTKAIMPVHFAGQACDLDAIYEIAARHSLALIIDAAHGSGCEYDGLGAASDALFERLADRYGVRVPVITAFSFYATKNMTTGEGGMITTGDADLAAELAQLRLHGMSRDAWKRYARGGAWAYDVLAPGHKSNMTDIQAALGIHQLARLPEFIARRRELAAIYDQVLRDVPEIQTPQPTRPHVYHLYVIKLLTDLSAPSALRRNQLIEQLASYNIGTSVHFIPFHRFTLHDNTHDNRANTAHLTNADHWFERIVSLPLFTRMTNDDARFVAEVVEMIVTEGRRS